MDAIASPAPAVPLSVLQTLRHQALAWVVGLLIALAGAFSDKIVESTKLALNRADLRIRNFEALGTDLSEFAFNAELIQEFLEKNQTRRETLVALVTDYNNSITKIRKNEFVYAAWVARYWGHEELSQFEGLMKSVRAFDQTLHSLNDEFEAVNLDLSKSRVDTALATGTAAKMAPQVDVLQKEVRALLTALR